MTESHRALPKTRDVLLYDTHRLIPSRHSDRGTVLSRLTEDETALNDLVELDGATNARLLGEEGMLPGIGVHELVYGVRYAHIVNAAFTHPSPFGARFNDSQRGAWYAALELETSAAEVAFHKRQQLEEIDWEAAEVSTYDDYLADFAAEFHDLTKATGKYQKYLEPFPVPDCYREPQQLAAELLLHQSNGILYPSVRFDGGICLVCFRPVLVYHVRRWGRFELRVQAESLFTLGHMREVKIA